MAETKENVQVGIVMGSKSDLPIMQDAADILATFDIVCEMRVLSAHRTPIQAAEYAETAMGRGLQVIIAGAGGAAHLAGVLAASTPLPIIGVPVPSKHLQGMDSLLSIVQMPKGVPVATVAIGGARNAGLLAVQIMGTANTTLRQRFIAYKAAYVDMVAEMDEEVQKAQES